MTGTAAMEVGTINLKRKGSDYLRSFNNLVAVSIKLIAFLFYKKFYRAFI